MQMDINVRLRASSLENRILIQNEQVLTGVQSLALGNSLLLNFRTSYIFLASSISLVLLLSNIESNSRCH